MYMGIVEKLENVFTESSTAKIAIFLLVSIIIVYGQSFGYDYNLDDQLVYQNMPATRHILKGLNAIFHSRFAFVDYRPVSVSTFYLEYILLGKSNPYFSHVVNVFLYFLLCISVFYLIRKLNIFYGFKYIFFSLLLFTLHPIHVSVVCNLKNRDNLLSMLFSIIVIIIFLTIIRRRKYYLWPILMLLFVLATWSKLDAVFLVLVLPAIYYYEKFDPKKPLTLLYAFLLFIFFSIFFTQITSWSESYVPLIENNYTINSITENPYIHNFSWVNRVKLTGITFLQYIRFFIIPFGYRFYYGTGYLPTDHFFTFSNILGNMLLIVSVLSVLYLCIIKSKTGFLLFWILASLAYCLQIIHPVPGLFADRYAFIASLGFCTLLVYTITEILPIQDRYKDVFLLFIVGIYFFFSFFSCAKWKNFDTLFTTDMPHLSTTYEPNRMTATTYLDLANKEINRIEQQDYLQKSIKYAQQARALYKGDNYMLHLLGTVYYMKGDFPEAISYLQQAIEMNPKDVVAAYSLADVYLSSGNATLAASYYDTVFTQDKSLENIAYKVVDAYCKAGNFMKADSVNEVIHDAIDPKYIYDENKGYISLYRKDTADAYRNFESAIAHGLQDAGLQKEIENFKKMK